MADRWGTARTEVVGAAERVAPETPAGSVRVVEALPEPGSELWDTWSAWAEAAGNVFATPELARVWWRHFGHGHATLVLVADPHGALAAIWPLYRARRGPLRVLRLVGHGCADELGPVCDPKHRAMALDGLARALAAGVVATDVAILEHVPARLADGDGPPVGIGAALPTAPAWPGGELRLLRREDCPVVRGHDTGWEGFLASRSKNFRAQARNRERRLARDHDITYLLADTTDQLPTALDDLLHLHHLRFGDEGSRAFQAGRDRFHRDWAAVALERGWLRLWRLRIDDQVVAAEYGFRYAGTESTYQSGRDPAWRRDSVGFVLLNHAVRRALDDGLAEYRLLRGDEEYKHRVADTLDQVVTVGVPGSRLGAMALGAAGRLLRRRPGRPPNRAVKVLKDLLG